MNWSKVAIAAVLAGIANWLVNFVLHGLVLGDTYTRYPDVFSQTQANPMWFLLVAIFGAFLVAVLFAKTRSVWPDGIKGGLCFGALIGAIAGSLYFYQPLVMEGYPYYLAWCWMTIEIIGFSVEGAIMSLVIKK